MQSRIRITTLVLAAGALLLSGCLVDKDDFSEVRQNKIQRTTDRLHIYQAGDFIEYNVQATRIIGSNPSEDLTGTLRVQWETTDTLRRPTTNDAIVALKETTTLIYHNSGDASDDGNAVRYITQDANGQITAHAIDANGADHYWLRTLNESDPNKTESFVVFHSPIVVSETEHKINFEVREVENCSLPPCNQAIGQFSETYTVVNDSREIPTNIGTFTNPFEIRFSGNTQPLNGNVPPIIDFRLLCSTRINNINLTAFGFAGIGKMWILPEIGMIQLENACNEPGSDPTTGNRTDYILTLSNTNIPLP
jgi:hypothetical protein